MKYSAFVWLFFSCAALGSAHGEPAAAAAEVSTERYNILAFLPTETKSHFIGMKPLVRALVAKGHNVTLVSPFSIGKTDLPHTHIKVQLRPPFDLDMITVAKRIIFPPLAGWLFGLSMADQALSMPAVRDFLLNDRSSFDVVVFENFLDECFVTIGHKYGAPVVQLIPSSVSVRVAQWHGQPFNPSYVPEMNMGMVAPMGFWQRALNSFSAFFLTWCSRLYYVPRQQALADKHFVYPGSDRRPSMVDMLRNISLTLINNHPAAIGSPVPSVPSFVNVAGMHCGPAEPLPEDLRAVIESSEHGVVYFSLGSVVKSSKMPPEMVTMLLTELSTIKQTVLWKWENDKLPELPKNVIVRKWFPQNDIIGHPKCKLFITHGGVLSAIESTYHGVPLLGISLFGDQPYNMLLAEQRGYAIHLPYSKLTKESFGDALRRLAEDPSYSLNAKKASKIFTDNPVRPLDNAVYWIEYVTRHKGAPHLRTAANQLYWFQYYLLDVVAFFLFVFLVMAYAIFKLCAKCCCRSKTVKQPVEKKNQ